MAKEYRDLIVGLDIGTSKIACLIARLKPCAPSDALRGRSHAVELIGLSHIQSRGVKAGAVINVRAETARLRDRWLINDILISFFRFVVGGIGFRNGGPTVGPSGGAQRRQAAPARPAPPAPRKG